MTTEEILKDFVDVCDERIYDLEESLKYVKRIKKSAEIALENEAIKTEDFLESAKDSNNEANKFLVLINRNVITTAKYADLLNWITYVGPTPKRFDNLMVILNTFDTLRKEYLKSLEVNK